jgi:hypothetical protein
MTGRLDALRELLDRALVELPVAELPELVGVLAAADARARARLTAPASTPSTSVELVTADVVAERFHLAVSTVHEAARLGRIPSRMFGRYRRFDLVELRAAGLNPKWVSVVPGQKPNGDGRLQTPVTTQSPPRAARERLGDGSRSRSKMARTGSRAESSARLDQVTEPAADLVELEDAS